MKKRTKQIRILVTICIFTFMSVLDSSIVNIALPTISRKLTISLSQSEWIVSSYLLVICCSLLLFGRLGDTYGKARVFKIGGIIFVIGSLFCGLSQSLPILVGSRVVQAIGSGMMMSNNNGIITETFEPNERGRALGMVGAFVSLGAITGPGLGGLLLAKFSWTSIFWVNVPIGILTILLGYGILPKSRSRKKEAIDYVGFIALSFVILIMYGFIQFMQKGSLLNWKTILLFFLFLLSFFGFIILERKKENPLLQLRIFENRLFSSSLLTALLVFISAFFYTMIMPFYLQDVKELTASKAGMVMMVFPLVQVILAPFAGYLADKFDKQNLTIVGLLLLTLGQITYLFWQPSTPIMVIIPSIILSSVGNSLFQAPNNTIIMNVVDRQYLGIAGALNALARNLGMVLGVALSTLILTVSISHISGHTVTYLTSNGSIFVQGMRYAFGFSTLLCFVAFGLTLNSKRQKVTKS